MTYDQEPLDQLANEFESAAKIASGHADVLFASELALKAKAIRLEALSRAAAASRSLTTVPARRQLRITGTRTDTRPLRVVQR